MSPSRPTCLASAAAISALRAPALRISSLIAGALSRSSIDTSVLSGVRLVCSLPYSMLASLVLSRSRHAVGAVLLHPLLQLRLADRRGIVAGGCAASEAPWFAEFARRVVILLLHPVQQRIQRLAQ